jgi:glycosyltransferase involved in cell wall biosynthesis
MIALSYIGVHQIFQLALAAHEMGKLETLHCSLVDLPGKWGSHLARRWHAPSLRPLGWDSLPPERLIEHPLPLLCHRLYAGLTKRQRGDHAYSNAWFDRLTARALHRSDASVVVAAETCALHTFQTARSHGMQCVLDCPGVPVRFLDAQAREAADELGLPTPNPANSSLMLARKRDELAQADKILCCSEFQAQQLAAQGIPSERLRVVPLWADHAFWSAIQPKPKPTGSPLRVLFVGTLSLKKGLPYLLAALTELGNTVECRLVGTPSSEMLPALARLPANCHFAGHATKEQLRDLYASHDVLVMPTLGDSFGFVGMEAMSAGLPVIASTHAGLPLPHPDWRVAVRNAEAITARLLHYVHQPDTLVTDSATASAFAAQFTPDRYRKCIREIYQECLT